ncbi:MAG: hypothetical protein C0501_22525 [Isosphaera sp.]|nr:hypothetical protein [Isosphaera sp.]
MPLLAALLAVSATAPPDDKKDARPALPVTLTVVSKADKYVFDGGGLTPAEYKKALEERAKNIAKGADVKAPKPLAVDLVLVLKNTGKDKLVLFVGGDPNVFTLELAGGAGVVTMPNPVAFTEEFRAPRAVALEPGGTYEVPVKVLADGHRGLSRLVFWTGPGEYKLTAKYVLAADANGAKGPEVTSGPAKIVVAEK